MRHPSHHLAKCRVQLTASRFPLLANSVIHSGLIIGDLASLLLLHTVLSSNEGKKIDNQTAECGLNIGATSKEDG